MNGAPRPLLSWTQLLLGIASIAATGLYTVSTIEGTTRVLEERIRALGVVVEKLDATIQMSKTEARARDLLLSNHEARLSVLEAKTE